MTGAPEKPGRFIQHTILPPDVARAKPDDVKTRRPARYMTSGTVAAARNDEAAVKAVMRGVQTEA